MNISDFQSPRHVDQALRNVLVKFMPEIGNLSENGNISRSSAS